MEQAQAAGPPSDDELSRLTVVHAVVIRSRRLTLARATAIADEVAQRVAGAGSPDEFQSRAEDVTPPDARVLVERLPAFGADGFIADGRALDPSFVAASFALRAPGDTSAVVVTTFGWHVIRLISREPPDAASIEQARQDLFPVVAAMRARGRVDAMIRARRRRVAIETAGDADQSMEQALSGQR